MFCPARVMTDTSSPQSLHSLYSEHHGWLQSWLRRRIGCPDGAADLAQDTFVRLLSRPRRFDGGRGVRAYLSRIADGLLIDQWRRRKIEQAWLDTLAAQAEVLSPSPEYQALVMEALYEVDAMLRTLPLRVRQAFVMAQLHGLGYRQIAGHLGVSERMVKKYMAQAMLHCLVLEAGLQELRP